MLAELLSLNLFHFLLVFARVGSALMMMPGLNSGAIPPQARLGVGLTLALLVTPVVSDLLPGYPNAGFALMLILATEITIGLFIGLVARALMAILQVAGTVIALAASIANTFVHDPIQEAQSSIVANFLTMIGLTLIFVTGLHHLLIRAAVESYGLFVPGLPLPVGDMVEVFSKTVAHVMTIGIQLSMPFIFTSLVYNLALGIINRLAPQVPVFFVGMPLQIVGQMILLMISLSGLMIVFLSEFEAGMIRFLAP